jgi:hypothetical protein
VNFLKTFILYLEIFDVSSPRLNVAHVDATLDVKVAGETPSVAPGVADNPVGSGRNGGRGDGGTIPDDNDGVIDIVFISENARRIAVDSRSATRELICECLIFSLN